MTPQIPISTPLGSPDRPPSATDVPALILASKSPRRVQLLTQLGYTFLQIPSPFEDPPQPDHSDDPTAQALDLARKKAHSLAVSHDFDQQRPIGQPAVILAADTIVIASDGTLLGTPTDRTIAEFTLRKILDDHHDVVTAVVLLQVLPNSPTPASEIKNQKSEIAFTDIARVHMGPIPEPLLQRHLLNDAWIGKAGGYNFARVTSDPDPAKRWPVHLQQGHCSHTVTGLPTRALPQHLAAMNVFPSPAASTAQP